MKVKLKRKITLLLALTLIASQLVFPAMATPVDNSVSCNTSYFAGTYRYTLSCAYQSATGSITLYPAESGTYTCKVTVRGRMPNYFETTYYAVSSTGTGSTTASASVSPSTISGYLTYFTYAEGDYYIVNHLVKSNITAYL